MNSAKTVGNLTILAVAVSLVAWEIVNYASTADAIKGMFGNANFVITILGVAVIFTDLLYLSQISSAGIRAAETGNAVVDELRESIFGVVSVVSWLMLTAFDTFLTWFWLATLMETQIATNGTNAPAAVREYLHWFPIVVAVMSWAIQAGLMIAAAQIVTNALASGSTSFGKRSGGRRSKPQRPNNNPPASAFRQPTENQMPFRRK